jgi:hypothetical protein
MQLTMIHIKTSCCKLEAFYSVEEPAVGKKWVSPGFLLDVAGKFKAIYTDDSRAQDIEWFDYWH